MITLVSDQVIAYYVDGFKHFFNHNRRRHLQHDTQPYLSSKTRATFNFQFFHYKRNIQYDTPELATSCYFYSKSHTLYWDGLECNE